MTTIAGRCWTVDLEELNWWAGTGPLLATYEEAQAWAEDYHHEDSHDENAGACSHAYSWRYRAPTGDEHTGRNVLHDGDTDTAITIYPVEVESKQATKGYPCRSVDTSRVPGLDDYDWEALARQFFDLPLTGDYPDRGTTTGLARLLRDAAKRTGGLTTDAHARHIIRGHVIIDAAHAASADRARIAAEATADRLLTEAQGEIVAVLTRAVNVHNFPSKLRREGAAKLLDMLTTFNPTRYRQRS